jgi:uncharacterized membrane-anchored protein
MSPSLRLALFAVLVLVQLAVPASMIASHQLTLTHGEPFRFVVRPIDPIDPFRGRYVIVQPLAAQQPAPQGVPVRVGETVYLALAHDADGFAEVLAVSLEAPRDVPYVTARVRFVSGGTLHLELPFERFYMNERQAPRAEAAMWGRPRDTEPTFISVRVRNGRTVLEQLYLAGVPVHDYLHRERRPAP